MDAATIALIAKIIETAIALVQAGGDAVTFLQKVGATIQAAQAAGTDPTPADWAFLDQAATSAKATFDTAIGAAEGASAAQPPIEMTDAPRASPGAGA